jgi:hypothetical protein
MKLMRIRMKVMGIRNTAFYHLRIDGDQDPDPGYHFEGNPDLPVNVLPIRNNFILACHRHIDVHPDPVYYFDENPDPTMQCNTDP